MEAAAPTHTDEQAVFVIEESISGISCCTTASKSTETFVYNIEGQPETEVGIWLPERQGS